ncbi:MAG: hypothetical protein Kow0063_19780 [Anaerolineae bacterium]
MTDLIEIDYQALTFMIVGAFGLVGFFRGWWKEAFTTGLLTLLLLMLKVPEVATPIVNFIDTIVDAVWGIIQSLSETSELVAAAVEVGPPPEVDPQRYWVYVITLIVLVIASYFIGKTGLTQYGLSAGARLLGAIFGFYNGFVTISLVREFVIGRFLPNAPAFAATATPPSTVSVQVVDIPPESIADSPIAFILIILGLILTIIAIVSGWSRDKTKVKRKTPWGYTPPPKKKDEVAELLKKLSS